MTINLKMPDIRELKPRITVFGVGGAGGNAEYLLRPAFKKDGHEMFGQADGLALWTTPVASFLSRLE